MTLRDDVVEWTQDRPQWQRDALRRLIQTPALSEPDIAELLDLCLSAHGIRNTDLQCAPLRTEHFVDDARDERSIVLLEVRNVANANAIRSAEPLTFAAEGITLVYGQNGVGKSGYIRLLKQLCRARGQRPRVLPNVHRDPPHTPLSATVTYAVDGAAVEHTWTVGAPSPP